jgi:hypothetical protein
MLKFCAGKKIPAYKTDSVTTPYENIILIYDFTFILKNTRHIFPIKLV